jgi:rod shape-determining protein MreC
MDFLYRWRRPIVVTLIVAVLSAMLSYTARVRHQVLTLSAALAAVTSPAAGVVTAAGDRVAVAYGTVSHLFQLEQENQRLLAEVALLQSMRLELQEVEADNNRLRSLLYLKQQLGSRWQLLPASVIGRNPESWFDTVTLNRGSASGVRVGMPVIVAQGVVGRVVAVSPTTCTVLLLLDPSSGVGAMDVRSRAAGVVLGQVPVTGTLEFQLFSHNPDVEPGDAVITSGFSQFYPKGLLIGVVSQVRPSANGLTEVATVVPSVNFNQLETVMIVLAHPAGESAPPLGGGVP